MQSLGCWKFFLSGSPCHDPVGFKIRTVVEVSLFWPGEVDWLEWEFVGILEKTEFSGLKNHDATEAHCKKVLWLH